MEVILVLVFLNFVWGIDLLVIVFFDSNRYFGFDDGVNIFDFVGNFLSSFKKEWVVDGMRYDGYRLLNEVELWEDI